MDRTMFEQEWCDILEETFKDFPLTHVFFDTIERGQTDSISKLCQKLLTEFPIDTENRSSFEFLVRAVQSSQPMSLNTTNDYTAYLSTVHDVVETIVSETFTVSEVMFFLEMNETEDIPMDDVRQKNIQIFRSQDKPTKSQAFKIKITGNQVSNFSGCTILHGVIETRVLFTLRRQGFPWPA